MNTDKLQYTLEEAYSGNIEISQFKNGKLISKSIESDWALEGYLNCLESEGYERAYNVDEYKNRWEEAKREEELAHKLYLEALMHPLIIIEK